MKNSIKPILSILILIILSCNSENSKNTSMNKEVTPINSKEDAKKFIKENFNEPAETLLLSDSLNDKMGMNMAIITDAILKAGYFPDGFEQKEGYRIYKYKKE